MAADKEEFDPVGKGHLLALHIMLKGFEAGALYGVCLLAPIMAWRLRHRPSYELAARLPNALAVSAVTGTALAGGVVRQRHSRTHASLCLDLHAHLFHWLCSMADRTCTCWTVQGH